MTHTYFDQDDQALDAIPQFPQSFETEMFEHKGGNLIGVSTAKCGCQFISTYGHMENPRSTDHMTPCPIDECNGYHWYSKSGYVLCPDHLAQTRNPIIEALLAGKWSVTISSASA